MLKDIYIVKEKQKLAVSFIECKLCLVVGKTKCQEDADAGNAWVPSCDEDGGYTPGQCDQATGSCWCVDRLGREIPRTRDADTKGRPTCDVTGTFVKILIGTS